VASEEHGDEKSVSAGAPEARVHAAASVASKPFDAYVSDPWKPVPYTAQIRTTEGNLYTIEDQRFARRRPDVLVYETEPLDDDVTVSGPVKAMLDVSTTGTDGDWVAKLIDVYPSDAPPPMGGYEMLVTGDIMRGKFSKQPVEARADGPEPGLAVAFELGDKNHTFRKGHRIMVQIQSSWFPMFDRNPQTFVDIYSRQGIGLPTGHATRLSFTDAELEDSALRQKKTAT